MNLNHEVLPAISKQRKDDSSIYKKYQEVCHQSQIRSYKLYLNIDDPTFAIYSAIINGPKDSNNITPPSCQPAAIVIEKKQNM